MKHTKKIIAVLTALLVLAGLFAGCKTEQVKEATIALEAGSITQLTFSNNTVESDNEAVNGKKLAEAINAVIAGMIETSDLTEEANTVLISIDSQDTAMQKTVLNLVRAAFEANSFTGAAMCQYAADPAQGKAQLIQSLCDVSEVFVADELQTLSINQLKLVCESTTLSSLQSAGNASQVALVGTDTAIDVAMYYADTNTDAVTDLNAKLDYSAGTLYYDVKFTQGDVEQEAYVDATTGEVLYSGVVGGESNMEQDDTFTEEDAIAAACTSVGVEVVAAKDVTCTYTEHANPPMYEVDFTHEDKQYHILVAAGTGLVLESDVPTDDIVEPDDAIQPDYTEPNFAEDTANPGAEEDISEGDY